MSEKTTGPVCLDDLVTVLAEYDPEARWNGFLASPWLDAWSVVLVLDRINHETPEYGYDYTFGDDGLLVLVDRQYRDEDPDGYEPEGLTPNADGLYALGSYGWVWSEDDDPDLCHVCGGLNDAGDEPGQAQTLAGAWVPLCSVACTEAFYRGEEWDDDEAFGGIPCHGFEHVDESRPEACLCGAMFVHGFHLDAVKRAHLEAVSR